MTTSTSDIEASILSTVLSVSDVNNQQYYISLLSFADFKDNRHKLIFSAMKGITNEGIYLDPVTVGNALKDKEAIRYFAELVLKSFNNVYPGNLTEYINILKYRNLKSQLIGILAQSYSQSQKEESNAIELISNLRSELDELISNTPIKPTAETAQQIIDDYIANREYCQANKLSLIGIPTGIQKLDEITNGLQNGTNYVIAGRPSMGKSALALGIAINAALNGYNTLFLSLEMSNRQNAIRTISYLLDRDIDSITKNSYPLENVKNKIQQYQGLPLYFDDSTNYSVKNLSGRIASTIRQFDIQLLVIDYLQLVGTDRHKTRNDEITVVSREVNALKKSHNIPILTLSQLSRDNEKRGKKDLEPILSDLRDSGSIEQDADVVIFIHRPEYYGLPEPADLAYLKIAKNRNGAIARIKTKFTATKTKFTNWGNEEPF